MMKFGKNHKFGDVIVAEVQFTDTFEIKKRPAFVLFEEYGNVVSAAITSNPQMKGVPLTKKEGMKVDSVIKLNYIFTVSENMISNLLFSVTEQKRNLIKEELVKKLN